MSEHAVAYLAKNILYLRRLRGLSQKALGELAGVPRSTLTHMESGSGNPTLTAVCRVAQALGVAVDELLSRPRGPSLLVRAAEVPALARSGGRATLYKLLPDKMPGMELDRMEIGPGARIKGVPHLAHTREYFTCVAGEVDIYSAGDRFHLEAGDVLAFPGDQAHSYHNPSGGPATGISVVVLPSPT